MTELQFNKLAKYIFGAFTLIFFVTIILLVGQRDKLQKENAELKTEIEQYLRNYPCFVISKGKWLSDYETYELIDTCLKKVIWLEGVKKVQYEQR